MGREGSRMGRGWVAGCRGGVAVVSRLSRWCHFLSNRRRLPRNWPDGGVARRGAPPPHPASFLVTVAGLTENDTSATAATPPRHRRDSPRPIRDPCATPRDPLATQCDAHATGRHPLTTPGPLDLCPGTAGPVSWDRRTCVLCLCTIVGLNTFA